MDYTKMLIPFNIYITFITKKTDISIEGISSNLVYFLSNTMWVPNLKHVELSSNICSLKVQRPD